MTNTLRENLAAYVTIKSSPGAATPRVLRAGERLPIAHDRQDAAYHVADTEPMKYPQHAADAWAAGVGDAADNLRRLVAIRNPSHPEATPHALKRAAEALLALL